MSGVAAYGRGFPGYPREYEVQQALLGFGLGQCGLTYALGQTGAAAGGGIPFIHAVEQSIASMDDVYVRLH